MWESFTGHDLQINENLTLMKPSNTVSDSLSFMMKVTFFMSRGKWKVAHQYYPELLSCHFAGQHIGNVLGSTAYNAEAMGGQYTRRWCTGNVRCGVEYWVMGDGQWGTPITMSWDANTAPQYWCHCWSTILMPILLHNTDANAGPIRIHNTDVNTDAALQCTGSILYAMQRSCRIQFNIHQDNTIQWYNNVTTLKVVQCLWNENNTQLFVVMPLCPNFWPFILEERERPLSPCR